MLTAPPWKVSGAGWVATWTEDPAGLAGILPEGLRATGRMALPVWTISFASDVEAPRDPAVMESREALLGFEVELAGDSGRSTHAFFWSHSWVERDWLLAIRWLSGIGAKIGVFLAPSGFSLRAGNVKITRNAEPVLASRTLHSIDQATELPGLRRSLGHRHLPDPFVSSAGRPLVDDVVEEDRSSISFRKTKGARAGLLHLFNGSNEDFGSLGGREIAVTIHRIRFSYRFNRLRTARLPAIDR